MTPLELALPARTAAAPAPIGLLAAIAFASALAGALVTLAVWRQLGPAPADLPVVQAPAALPAPVAAPAAAPSMHELLRGRDDAPSEPVPTF